MSRSLVWLPLRGYRRSARRALGGRKSPGSFGVIYIRGASASDACQCLFWRSVAFSLALSTLAAQRRRTSPHGGDTGTWAPLPGFRCWLHKNDRGGFDKLGIIPSARGIQFVKRDDQGKLAGLFVAYTYTPTMFGGYRKWLKRVLLDPLGPQGSRTYCSAIFDHLTDAPLPMRMLVADPASVLVFDGIFLHRPELRDVWDLSIFLDAPFDVTIPRGAGRGAGWGSPDVHAPSNQRYIEGQRLYLRECEPQTLANFVIDYSNLAEPVVVARRWPKPR